jgi:hypothetical protein
VISGSDTVFISCGDIREAIDRFLNGRLQDWPGMRVSVSGISGGRFRQWAEYRSQFPPEGEILVARDETMEAAWNEVGYVLGPEGEGPFAIFYETVKRAATQMKALVDPYNREGFRFEPYELTLVGCGLYLVTLVTPDLDSRFSRLLVDSLVTALGQ